MVVVVGGNNVSRSGGLSNGTKHFEIEDQRWLDLYFIRLPDSFFVIKAPFQSHWKKNQALTQSDKDQEIIHV